MTNRNTQHLIDEIKARMPEVIKPRGIVGAISVWTRPPLITNAMVGTASIDAINQPTSRLTPEQLILAYEEFVHGYLIGDDLAHRRPHMWVRRNLGLTQWEARRVAPVVLRRKPKDTPADWLSVVLWIINTSTKGSKLTFGEGTALVEIAGKVIGVDKGFVLSEYAKPTPLVYVPDFPSVLTTETLGVRATCNREGLNRYYIEAGKQEEGRTLQLALRALYYRLIYPYRLEDRMYGKAAPTTGRKIVTQVRNGMKAAANPRAYLRSILVPRYTTLEDFIQQFGNPYRPLASRPRPEVIAEWLDMFETIIIKAEEE